MKIDSKKKKGENDQIIIDAPPLKVDIDTFLLVEFTEEVIYAIAYGVVFKKELKYTKKLVEKAEVSFYRIVLNKIDESRDFCKNYVDHADSYKYS